MSNKEKLQYARSRLGLARMVGDTAEVEKWKEHVAYWEAAQQSMHPTSGEAPDLRALSTPEVHHVLEVLSTPPTCG